MKVKQEEIFSVSEANTLVRNVIESSLPPLWIEGEVANFVRHSSGHIYFSLKDDDSSIKCAFFRGLNISLAFNPKNGDKVLCHGKIDVYERTGTYQLLVKRMLQAGIGELQLKFLALKKKLQSEGLFLSERKKKLPLYPEKIGVVTSPTGAAFQDIKNVITRRFPHKLYLYPAAVQGDNAVPELIEGLNYFNEQHQVDLIIIGRGGGSQEDLFCFNDEKLARAIFASKTPIISAVGHEIDFTIADFVADVRAPTPSAAAELAVPNKADIIAKLDGYQRQLNSKAERTILFYHNSLSNFEKVLYQWHPRSVLYKYQQRLDEAVNSFTARMQDIGVQKQRVEKLSSRLLYLAGMLSADNIYKNISLLDSYENRLKNGVEKKLDEKRNALDILSRKLSLLSPEVALRRGYAIIRAEKKIVNSVTKINPKDKLELLLQDGSCQCVVEEVNPEKVAD